MVRARTGRARRREPTREGTGCGSGWNWRVDRPRPVLPACAGTGSRAPGKRRPGTIRRTRTHHSSPARPGAAPDPPYPDRRGRGAWVRQGRSGLLRRHPRSPGFRGLHSGLSPTGSGPPASSLWGFGRSLNPERRRVRTWWGGVPITKGKRRFVCVGEWTGPRPRKWVFLGRGGPLESKTLPSPT